MIKRTVEISRDPAHLSVHDNQLVLKRHSSTLATIPCEDIGMVLVDHPQTTYTHGALAKLAESDAVVVVCGRDHLPIAVLLPMTHHSEVVWRLRDQLDAGRPLAKQLWRQIVRAKIRAQAANIPVRFPAHRQLLALIGNVRSGDPTNVEAQSARIYWRSWLLGRQSQGEAFSRDTGGSGINKFLNYGYAVVRAATARAIVGAGLLPGLGIHHSNRSNSFCLADDLMEPLRPLVDAQVRDICDQGDSDLTQTTKAKLLQVLAQTVTLNDTSGPLMVQLHRYVASFVRCIAGESRKLEIPSAC